MKRLLWWFCFFAFFWKPLIAQTIPPDFHAWFLQQVAGRPFGQQTLTELQAALNCAGSALTPPNADGDRTKIWEPNEQRWKRVGFGEGVWVWVDTTPGPPPTITPCTSAAPPPQPIPAVDFSAVLNRLDFVYQQLYAQQERIHANAVARDAALSAQLKAHDEKPNELTQVFGNRYVQIILATLATAITTNQVTK